DKREWQSVFRQLVAQGHLDVDVEGHGGLHLGETAPAVLKGELAVPLRHDPADPLLGETRRKKRAARSLADVPPNPLPSREREGPAAERREGEGAPSSDAPTPPPTVASPADEALWQALRARRLSLAREQGVPPYVIFHDATLAELVRRRPRDLGAMSLIPGIGRSKLERYGLTFLALIADHPAS
ncbi:MAG TPA: HRDC domain-containing protein, partial [Stellaceae bacterium]|nr:HRDC domain-containing protein [Stellaceae bacterium]